MTENPAPAPSGYSLDRVYFNHQALKAVENLPDLPDGGGQIGFGWDWRITAERLFEVALQISIDPSKARLEEVRLTMCGVFRIEADEPTIPLANFVRIHAPAIMMPYVRECLSSLTGRGFYGTFYLPPLNVFELMKGMDPDKTTGAGQLREGATLVPLAPRAE